MKRTLVVAATLAAATLAPLSTPAQAARAATDLPTAATLKDAHHDVAKFNGNISTREVSHPYDTYKVRGTTTTTHLIVTITLDDLTPHNTRVYQRPDGWWTYNGTFQAQVFINGQWRWSLNRTSSENDFAQIQPMIKGKYGIEHGNDHDCTPTEPPGTVFDDTGVTQHIDTTRDTFTYTAPLACLGIQPGDTLRIATQVGSGEWGHKWFSDHTDKTPKFTLR